MGNQGKPSARGAYDAIVYIEGSEVVAEDGNGRKIASGVAGTDDVSVIQSAITLMSGTLIKIVGSFNILSSISIQKNLTFDASDAMFFYDDISGNQMIYVNYPVSPTTRQLASNAVVGDNIITVVDASGVRAGDLVKIYDDAIFNATDYPTIKTGELHKVVSIASNTIIIEDILCGSYDTSRNAMISTITPLTVSLLGGSIVSSDNTANRVHISIVGGKNCIVDGWTLNNPGKIGISVATSYGTRIRYNDVSGCLYVGGGACISNNSASAHTEIYENYFASSIHAVTNGNSAVSGGEPRICLIHDNNAAAFGDGAYVFDAHALCWSIYVKNNVITCNGTAWAVVSGAALTYVESNTLYGGRGVSLRNAGPLKTVIIRGNYQYAGYHIFGDTISSSNIGDIILENNKCYSCTGEAIRSTKSANVVLSGNKLVNSSDVSNIFVNIQNVTHGKVSHNTVEYAYEHGVKLASCSGIDIVDNIITDPDRHDTGNRGILLSNCLSVMICRNRISDSTGYMNYGISAEGTSDYIFAYDNIISGAGVASINNVGSHSNNARNNGYCTNNSGSSTGTGSEQPIPHNLAAIPTGCKAWIKYLVGTRYITEMVPFDATNIYPTVETGVAYEWRIE